MNAPTPTSTRHGAFGRGTSRTAGKTTAANRMAAKRSGGTSCMPQWMTTKLKPQIVATMAASSESRRFTPPASRT